MLPSHWNTTFYKSWFAIKCLRNDIVGLLTSATCFPTDYYSTEHSSHLSSYCFPLEHFFFQKNTDNIIHVAGLQLFSFFARIIKGVVEPVMNVNCDSC